MINGIVFNHYSLPFPCKNTADLGLMTFFNLIRVCNKTGLKILFIDEDQDKSLMNIELAKEYFIRDWFSSAKSDPSLLEWCRFLKLIETRQPLFDNIEYDDILQGIEVGLPNEARGKNVFLASFSYDTFLISFSTYDPWLSPYIDIWVFELEVSQDLKYEKLLNICNESTLKIHKKELERRRSELIKEAKDIWDQRKELFPNLILLPDQIGSMLQSWSARPDILQKAKEALFILENFSDKWKAGEIKEYRHETLKNMGLAAEVSGESESVRKDSSKRNERVFWTDEGNEIFCENHIKLPSGYRLHFYPDKYIKCVYVAYLGPHLSL